MSMSCVSTAWDLYDNENFKYRYRRTVAYTYGVVAHFLL